jgi:hypothetical protein
MDGAGAWHAPPRARCTLPPVRPNGLMRERARRACAFSSAPPGVNVRLGVRVVGVTERCIQLKGGEELPYGCVVWSTGNAARPLVLDIADQLPEQQELNAGRPAAATKLITDPYLRCLGCQRWRVGACLPACLPVCLVTGAPTTPAPDPPASQPASQPAAPDQLDPSLHA